MRMLRSYRSIIHYLVIPIAVLAIAEKSYAATSAICASQLKAEVNKIAQDPKLQFSRLGVFAQTLTPSSQVPIDLDGDRYFIPASNAKLLTTAAALKLLGGDYRITTSLMSAQPPNAKGEIMGDLWLIGRGDPSFRSETSLKLLVKQLTDRGIKRIRGKIRTLSSLQGSGIGDSWEWQDLQEYYGAIASAATIDENALLWTISTTQVGKPLQFQWEQPQLANGWIVENQATTGSVNRESSLQVERPFGQRRLMIRGQLAQDAEPELGGVAVPDPEAQFLMLLRTELANQGIQIDSNSNSSLNPNSSQPNVELARVLSPPLRSLLQTTNKDSNNLYAELLLRILGSRTHEVENDDLSTGILIATRFLKSIGLSDRSFLLVDGSGLSRSNLITPRAMVLLLKVMASDRDFRNSLSVAGVDGTLVNRFKDTPAAGILQGKTGTMSGVIALSGYVKPSGYDEIAFAILINNGNLPTRELRPFVEAIALLLTSLKSC
ncbi:D-alanyl-D-alanine carboxypeptidase/D-alanyl-D-alanine-endopeptidase [Tumidithrix elongata RA019]|uniref:D-alanyl-D-alanine carboxypeptidase/D-alanyl-D-alanine-endopeptidase n=1 Tax=Tumidithrix elongata BACA0141 TaxID=2716417 RepID=A0AAW9Q209_9CYAN|nr:D-alanyl-D-alanine carboxypeptidase/D-alanyl-D-alanine-endopeptidase [Tumidithrix elongata RA019]